jgi:hypothetical protein
LVRFASTFLRKEKKKKKKKDLFLACLAGRDGLAGAQWTWSTWFGSWVVLGWAM